MKVNEMMTHDVKLASPDDTIEQAAKMMAKIDAGAIPVGDHDQLVGMITDRDMAVRALAKGKGPRTKIRDVMTDEVLYCFEDEEVDHVARNMSEVKVRRLPVVNREKRLIGIVSLGDVASEQGGKATGRTLNHISQPGGQHSQTAQERTA
jgi:CBS domain-containing protein